VAAAETEKDEAETTRLRGEVPRYEATACRAPGR
jgi:hypothetical protein